MQDRETGKPDEAAGEMADLPSDEEAFRFEIVEEDQHLTVGILQGEEVMARQSG